MRRFLLLALLIVALPLQAQERPIAVSTLTTTDTSSGSICVGCSAGPATGGLRVGAIAATGLFSDTLMGTHTFVAATGTGSQILRVQLQTAGTANLAEIQVGNDILANTAVMTVGSSTYTTIAAYGTSFAAYRGLGTGNTIISAENASAGIDLYTGGTSTANRRWGINAAGDWVSGTSRHIADSYGTPAVAAASGTAPVTTGNDYAFKFTTAGSGGTTWTVSFGHQFTAAPACQAQATSAGMDAYISSAAVGSIVITTTGNPGTMYVLCRGF